jgi:hypothetical protein
MSVQYAVLQWVLNKIFLHWMPCTPLSEECNKLLLLDFSFCMDTIRCWYYCSWCLLCSSFVALMALIALLYISQPNIQVLALSTELPTSQPWAFLIPRNIQDPGCSQRPSKISCKIKKESWTLLHMKLKVFYPWVMIRNLIQMVFSLSREIWPK